ncbi:MAG: 30S ribosomal protein S3 [Patescibacteria group bacterium]
MGKVNPIIFRLGYIKTWPSRWYAKRKAYPRLLRQDVELREHIRTQLKEAGVEAIEIERGASTLTLIIKAAKPGLVIGRGGAGIEELKKTIKKKFLKKENLTINIQEIERPALSSPVILQSMVADIEKRLPFRRVLKHALERLEKAGALGGRVWVAGRLNGAEIARTEVLSFGTLPLQNLRADIDYAFGEAQTIYGKIGVKVWVFKGEVFSKETKV